jgi:hypothetical protein
VPVRLGTAGAGLPAEGPLGLGTTAAIPLPACLLRDQSLADVGEPQTFKTGYSLGR